MKLFLVVTYLFFSVALSEVHAKNTLKKQYPTHSTVENISKSGMQLVHVNPPPSQAKEDEKGNENEKQKTKKVGKGTKIAVIALTGLVAMMRTLITTQ